MPNQSCKCNQHYKITRLIWSGQDDVNDATMAISSHLEKRSEGGSWRKSNFNPPNEETKFGWGTLTLVPGYFQQRRDVCLLNFEIFGQSSPSLQKLADQLYASKHFKTDYSREFLNLTKSTEAICNAIITIISPDMFHGGFQSIQELKKPNGDLANSHPNLDHWVSIFSGLELIVNQKTPFHRDPGVSPPTYDLLLSAGTYKGIYLDLPDIDTKVQYDPETAILVCGRILGHRIMEWTEGDRICMAHFVKDAVHDRLGIAQLTWTKLLDYWSMTPN